MTRTKRERQPLGVGENRWGRHRYWRVEECRLLVGAHEHFRTTGVDSNNATALTGILPSDRFGPDYAVNGFLPVASGEYGIYQRSDHVFVAHSAASPEPGDHLGPVPGSGVATKNYPPTCRCLGAVDTEHGIVLAASCRPASVSSSETYECDGVCQIMGRFGYIYTTLGDYAPTRSRTLGGRPSHWPS